MKSVSFARPPKKALPDPDHWVSGEPGDAATGVSPQGAATPISTSAPAPITTSAPAPITTSVPTPQGAADLTAAAGPAAGRMKRLTLDIPEDLHRRVKSGCAIRGEKIADVVRRYLDTEFPPS